MLMKLSVSQITYLAKNTGCLILKNNFFYDSEIHLHRMCTTDVK